jgi:hypothetical protein
MSNFKEILSKPKEVQFSDRYTDLAYPLNFRTFFSFVFSQAQ